MKIFKHKRSMTVSTDALTNQLIEYLLSKYIDFKHATSLRLSRKFQSMTPAKQKLSVASFCIVSLILISGQVFKMIQLSTPSSINIVFSNKGPSQTAKNDTLTMMEIIYKDIQKNKNDDNPIK